ncbi:PH domain-containing protein [Natrinema sp. SYSU A 869]|uniref:PH domain-containing protein n=1 Tax=Natrinema sp. SYSU A 869 TaxID=2871694 RepID=UPI001CA43EB1|nr:PH domain-containing protein [Natrinema sp. SYSU A 869]
MVSHERQVALEVSEPDIGFQAGFGFYLGIVVTGIVAIAGLLGDVATATLLGVLPSMVTAVAIVGHILAKRVQGLPERIGRSRWRRLACYVPAAAFAAALSLPTLAPIDVTGRFVIVTIVLAALAGVSGFGLERMAKNRYVDAITADEPAAIWTWHRIGLRNSEHVMNAMMGLVVVTGLVVAWMGSIYGVFWALYGIIMLASTYLDIDEDWSFDPNDPWNPPQIHAHEAGLVIDKSVAKTFIPWDEIEAVQVTDEALVLERRRSGLVRGWSDIRCSRSGIEDPEDVRETLEQLRNRAGTYPTASADTAD